MKRPSDFNFSKRLFPHMEQPFQLHHTLHAISCHDASWRSANICGKLSTVSLYTLFVYSMEHTSDIQHGSAWQLSVAVHGSYWGNQPGWMVSHVFFVSFPEANHCNKGSCSQLWHVVWGTLNPKPWVSRALPCQLQKCLAGCAEPIPTSQPGDTRRFRATHRWWHSFQLVEFVVP